MSSIIHDNQYIAGAHAKIAVQASVVILSDTANLITKQLVTGMEQHKATCVWIQVEDNPIYYTMDGTAPASDGSAGHLANVTDVIILRAWANIKHFKAIRVGTANANIKVTAFFNETGGWTP
jgi:hypothetical protein